MSLNFHKIPDEVFAELAAGNGGRRAIELLRKAQFSKNVLLIRSMVDGIAAAGGEPAARARSAYEQLAAVQQRAPGAVQAVLRHPAVGAWAWRTARSLHDDAAPPTTEQRDAAYRQLTAVAATADRKSVV